MTNDENLVPAIDLLKQLGYATRDTNQGAAKILGILNSLNITPASTKLYARGIRFLVSKDDAQRAIKAKTQAETKSDGGAKSRTLHTQDRSLARAILYICSELGINLRNHKHVRSIAEKDQETR